MVALVLLCASCSAPLGEKTGRGAGEIEPAAVARNEALRRAQEDLRRGDYEGARGVLEGIKEEGAEGRADDEAGFLLGLVRLLEIEDLESARACRDYFRAYRKAHPEGAHRAVADRIVRLLDRCLEETGRRERRIKDLEARIRGQEEEIRTLRYQIEKLEEIHRETERERRLLESE